MRSDPPCATLPGIVSWWPEAGAENVPDLMGNNPGTPQNGVGSCSAKVGYGLCFGGGEAVEIPYSSTLVAAPSFSVEAWVQPFDSVDDPVGQAFLFGQGYGRQLVVRNGLEGGLTVAFVIASSPWSFYEVDSVYPATEIPIDDWTHLVGSWDASAGTLSLYINGVLNARATPGAVPWDSGCAFHIGGVYDPEGDCAYVGQFFNGILDEVTYYAVALSADDVAALYAADYVGKCPEQPPCILTQPQSQRVPVGGTASLSVWAVGMGSLSYQWSCNDTPLPYATDSTLTLTSVQLSSSGSYTVVVSNPDGSTTSDAAILTVYTPICTEAGAGLVSWWAGEGNALDSLCANSGALQGGAGFGPGMVGQAFDLDGSSGYVEVPGSTTLNPTDAITVEAWVYPRLPLDPVAAPIIKKAGAAGGTDHGYSLELLSPDSVWFVVYLDGGQGWIPSQSAALPANRWSHVAGVYDGTGLSFYLNGTAVGTPVAVSGAIVPSANNLQIGHDPSNGDRYFNGLIDEPGVYNTALSQAQIQAIYDAGIAGKCQPSEAPSISNQPSSQTVNLGANVTFSVVATASLPLGYQWTSNGASIAGATASIYTRNNVQTADAGTYAVVVSSLDGQTVRGQVVSQNAILTVVVPPPVITQPPADQTVMEGSTATFNVGATGLQPLAYQWSLNGQDIPGATASSFTIGEVEVSASGSVYAVRVANQGGANSAGAALTVVPCDPTSRSLAVTAWKMSCEDKFWFVVKNLTGLPCPAGGLTFTSIMSANRTFYQNLQPWGWMTSCRTAATSYSRSAARITQSPTTTASSSIAAGATALPRSNSASKLARIWPG